MGHKQGRWQDILRSVLNGGIVNQKWNTDEHAGQPEDNDEFNDALLRQNHLVAKRVDHSDVTIKRHESEVENGTVHEDTSQEEASTVAQPWERAVFLNDGDHSNSAKAMHCQTLEKVRRGQTG